MSISKSAAARQAAPSARKAPARRPPAKPRDLVPTGARADFDLDALAHEATGEHFVFKAGGKLWSTFSPEEIPWLENSSLVERMSYAADQRPMLRMLLGEEQYERFLDLPPISARHLEYLFTEWQKFHGITVPESNASPRS